MNRFTQALRQMASRFTTCGERRSRRKNARNGQSAAVAVETCEPRQLLAAFQGFGTGTLVENAGFPPKDIAVGDVNRDGAADLVTFDRGNSVVKVFLSDGQGNFPSGNMRYYQAGTTTGTQPTLVDVNRDGALDIVLPQQSGSSVGVFLNNGNGTFQNRVGYSCGTAVNQVAIGDFNRDGSPDIALAEYTSTGYDSVRTLLNNGNGTFRQGSLFRLTNQYMYDFNCVSITAGDVNNDGKMDVAVNIADKKTIAILYGNGDGSLRAGTNISVTDARLQDIKLQDINRDGRVDLLFAKASLNKMTVGLGNGAGGFSFRDYSVGATPVSFDVGDVNRDGVLDIITSNQAGDSVSLLKGQANGTFSAATNYSTGPSSNVKIQPARIMLGDFNRDGQLDVAVGNSYINNLFNVRSTGVSVLKGLNF